MPERRVLLDGYEIPDPWVADRVWVLLQRVQAVEAELCESHMTAERLRSECHQRATENARLREALIEVRGMMQDPDGPPRGYWRGNASRRLYQQITEVLGDA